MRICRALRPAPSAASAVPWCGLPTVTRPATRPRPVCAQVRARGEPSHAVADEDRPAAAPSPRVTSRITRSRCAGERLDRGEDRGQAGHEDRPDAGGVERAGEAAHACRDSRSSRARGSPGCANRARAAGRRAARGARTGARGSCWRASARHSPATEAGRTREAEALAGGARRAGQPRDAERRDRRGRGGHRRRPRRRRDHRRHAPADAGRQATRPAPSRRRAPTASARRTRLANMRGEYSNGAPEAREARDTIPRTPRSPQRTESRDAASRRHRSS